MPSIECCIRSRISLQSDDLDKLEATENCGVDATYDSMQFVDNSPVMNTEDVSGVLGRRR